MIENIKQLIKTKIYTCVGADDHSALYQASGPGVKSIISPMRANRSFFSGKSCGIIVCTVWS